MFLMLAVLSGVAIAFSANFFYFDIGNTDRIEYFYGWSQQYISGGQGAAPLTSLLMNINLTLLDKVIFWDGIKRYSFGVIYIISLFLLIVIAYHREWKALIRGGSLVFLALFLDAIFRLRHYSSAYFIYIEFLVLTSIIISWVHLQNASYSIRNTNIYCGIAYTLVACIFFLQSNVAIIQNRFPAIDIIQPHQNFCDRGVYYPMIAEIIHHNDEQLCVQTILEGCSPDGTISSCRP